MNSQPSLIEVNAAIEQLITPSAQWVWVEPAKIVIAYCHDLKKADVHQITNSSVLSPNERGKIAAEDRERTENEEWAKGIKKERVGYYRIWKENEGLLAFHCFWKSSFATQGSDDVCEVYYLSYNPDTLEPEFLGIQCKRIVFKLGSRIILFHNYLKSIHGSIIMPELGLELQIIH